MSDDRKILVGVKVVHELIALSFCELPSLHFFELLLVEVIDYFGVPCEFMFWHEMSFVMVDIFTIFVPDYSYLDRFIMIKTICLSV